MQDTIKCNFPFHCIEDSACSQDNQIQLTAIRRSEEIILEQYDANGQEPANDKHDIDDEEVKINGQDNAPTVQVNPLAYCMQLKGNLNLKM